MDVKFGPEGNKINVKFTDKEGTRESEDKIK